MNSVIINGNLGREPEVSKTASGKKYCSFSIANEKGKGENGKEIQWIDCRAWDNKAEYLENYCHKGFKLLIQGRLMFDNYQVQNGERRKSVYVLCDRIEIERSTENYVSKGNTAPNTNPSENGSKWAEIDISNDDLPF